MIDRQIQDALRKRFFSGKAIILVGPRQVGKTTLIHTLLKDGDWSPLFLDGDDPTVRDLLSRANTAQLKQMIGDHQVIFIDEAQRIENIGLTSKIITDQFRDVQLILSGSSSFSLSGNVNEPLTGRKFTFELFPISWQEWQAHIGFVQAEQDLANRLLFGFYPEVLNHPDDRIRRLSELADSYLYRDVLQFGDLRKADQLQSLLKALALQLGNEVSYNELATVVGLDIKTVQHYIDLLEQAYVIFRLPAFSRNVRNEIKKGRKIYFYDNGVRNAILGRFEDLGMRDDTGSLWENFLMAERRKQLTYARRSNQMHFWRTTQQQEVDYVEVDGKQVTGFEFKWNPKRKVRFPKTFSDAYGNQTAVINPENFREFVLPEFG